MDFFLNGAELTLICSKFRESDTSLKYELARFKDPVFYMSLVGDVTASWSLTQEVAGLSPVNVKYFLSLNSVNSMKIFRKNSIVYVLLVVVNGF